MAAGLSVTSVATPTWRQSRAAETNRDALLTQQTSSYLRKPPEAGGGWICLWPLLLPAGHICTNRQSERSVRSSAERLLPGNLKTAGERGRRAV